MERIRIITVLLILFLSSFSFTRAQEKPGPKPEIGCDFVTSYIWRGTAVYSSLGDQNVFAPSFQPAFSLNYKGFKLGTWGSVDFTGTYKELDYYLSYSLKGFTLTYTDYYWASDWLTDDYFDYNGQCTSHHLEASLAYKGEKIPISFLVATMFYGDDKRCGDSTETNYSTYIEAGYTFFLKEYKFDLFLGVTPMDGIYGDGYGGKDGFAVVNTGVSASRGLKISEKFSLTLKASVIANPQARELYLVFGITL